MTSIMECIRSVLPSTDCNGDSVAGGALVSGVGEPNLRFSTRRGSSGSQFWWFSPIGDLLDRDEVFIERFEKVESGNDIRLEPLALRDDSEQLSS